MPEPTRLVVGAAVVDDLERPTRMLAARRSRPAELAGGWELPGGKVEPGETPEQALHRELREELGVSVVLGAPLPGPGPDATWPIGRRYRLHVRFAVVESGIPQALEDHDELRWLPTAELSAVPWLPADRPVVEALVSRLLGGAEAGGVA